MSDTRKRSSRMDMNAPDPGRRRVLRYGLNALGLIAGGQLLAACRLGDDSAGGLSAMPLELVESGVEGLLLPEGFSARVVARSGRPVLPGFGFLWHAAPDGGAVFAADGGGWIYVSNSEMDDRTGGASAVRFNASGDITNAYPILTGTSRNCAGGPTPWNTWLSCEEIPQGHVWECDPGGERPARELPALGSFMHEAVAVDPERMQLYLTEDRPDGRFYRFTPDSISDGVPDLASGVLEVAEVDGEREGAVAWHPIADPRGERVATRLQVPQSTAFAGGEGAWHADGIIYFTTKHDNRVWAYKISRQHLGLIYDDNLSPDPVLTGVDNVTVAQSGTVYVAEDGGNMQIVAIDPEQQVRPVLQLLDHKGSEITGPAFDASGTRLYFSSQRGTVGIPQDGVTYEVSGPFA